MTLVCLVNERMNKWVKDICFFEENRNENEFYLVAQGEMPFLWLEEYAGKIRLCDFEGDNS